MRVGVPKEIKPDEYRVGLTPASVRELVSHGHEVMVETGAGAAINYDDALYEAAGAQILPDAAAVFEAAELVVKVKEPQPAECAMLRPDQLLFTYLHLAADHRQADGLQKSGAIALAYETVTDDNHGLPLLAPMSEVAGRMAVQVGAHCLEAHSGGQGLLLGGVPGVPPGRVVILGGGVAGSNAMHIVIGMGAECTVVDRNIHTLRELDHVFGNRIRTRYSTRDALEEVVAEADLVIGTVLIPGATAPKLITREMIANMKKGAVVVDVSIDQGGCIETSAPTTHHAPTFVADGVVHYCVTNMPGNVPRTSTQALNNVTLPHVLAIADRGVWEAMRADPHLAAGLNVCRGAITHPAVARDLGRDHIPARDFFAQEVA